MRLPPFLASVYTLAQLAKYDFAYTTLYLLQWNRNITEKVFSFMGELCYTIVRFYGGGDGRQADTVSLVPDRKIFAIHVLTDNSVKTVDYDNIKLNIVLCDDRDLNTFVLCLFTGANRIFQNITNHTT